MPVGAAGKFQDNGVATGGELEYGRSVAVEFFVNENFGAVRLGRDGDGAEALRVRCVLRIGGRRGFADERIGAWRLRGIGRVRLRRWALASRRCL